MKSASNLQNKHGRVERNGGAGQAVAYADRGDAVAAGAHAARHALLKFNVTTRSRLHTSILPRGRVSIASNSIGCCRLFLQVAAGVFEVRRVVDTRERVRFWDLLTNRLTPLLGYGHYIATSPAAHCVASHWRLWRGTAATFTRFTLRCRFWPPAASIRPCDCGANALSRSLQIAIQFFV
jgi:hypothetical protein